MTVACVIVGPDSPPDLRQRVYRLRHAVYVGEMRLPLEAADESLFDAFDDRSYSLLATARGRDLGSLRITPKGQGRLELQEMAPRWSQLIEGCGHPAAAVCEWNRFLVVREARGGITAPALIYHAYRTCRRLGITQVFAAGKSGPLARNYMKYGATCVDGELVPYYLSGHELGRYCLLHSSLGGRDVLATGLFAAKCTAQYALLRTMPAAFNQLYRRGRGYAGS